MGKNIDIGGRLHSTATGNIVTGANEVLDDIQNKKQQLINTELILAVGTGGSVDSRISATKAEIIGDAATDYNTLGKLEDKIQAEVTRAETAEEALDGRVDTLEDAVSTVDERIAIEGAKHYLKSETYNKTELNNMITTPNLEYVTVTATDQTTAVTDVLPATGAADTVYRVGKWDGSQYMTNVYSEYSWDGTLYNLLDVKDYGIDDEPTPESNNLVKSGGIASMYGSYVENPEFVYVKTDGEGKILWAIKIDGTIYYGAGVPQQVIDYIEEKIAGFSPDEYDDIVAFLNDLEKDDKTLRDLLDEKVDKVEGKSLIDAEYANGVHYIENPEFIEVKVDSEGKILEATRPDGTKLFGAGIEVNSNANIGGNIEIGGNANITGDLSFNGADVTVIENPEFVGVWLDAEDKILFGVEQDGNFLFGCGVPQQVKEYIEQKIEELPLDEYDDVVSFIGEYLNNTTLEELLSKKVDGEYVENHEFVYVKTDSEDKILFGIKTDGEPYFGVGCPKQVIDYIEKKIVDLSLDEYEDMVSFLQDYLGGDTVLKTLIDNKVDKEEGKSLIDEDVAASKSVIEDHEGRLEIATDSEDKIISYRKDDGTLVENIGIETTNTTTVSLSANEVSIEGGNATLDSLELTEQGMTEFQQALKDSGFRPGGGGDYSDTITEKGKKPVFIPTPRLAMVNIIWDGNLSELSKSDRPDGVQKVNYDVKVPVEFFDGQGVYFKKYALMSAQGNSSMAFIKKNISLKFFDTEDVEGKKKKWGKGDTFGTVFGDWVMQKTYHLKAFYTDFIRGSSEVAYQLANEVYKTRGVYEDRPWKKALIDFSNINSCTPAGLSEDGIDDMNLQIDNGARCMPDGFPVIVYQNGEFYGIYVWMLKKDADNFNMDTSNPLHIHLDGGLTVDSIWGGTINWGAFEIRNPEDLVCMDGSDYDGDFPAELIDETSEHYDSTDENHVKSAQVKQYIIELSHRVGEINTLNSTNSTAAKELFDTYFDADNLIDYQLINMACGDTDGFGKNWQWTTWDGIKWYVNQYDKDMAFGNHFAGMYTRPVHSGWYGNNINLPSGLAIRYYTSEHKTRWQGLVSAGIINAEHIKSLVTAWISRIGKDNYVQEWKKWPESPCNRDSYIDFENWDFDNAVRQYDYPEGMFWDETTTYDTGNVVWFSFTASFFAKFKAKKSNIGKCPLTDRYSRYPVNMGYRDSAWRFYKYIEETISNQNSFINSLLLNV